MKHAPTIISELEAYIRQEGMTSAQFAASSEIHPRTLNNLILGHRPIAVQQLDRITKGMGLPDGYYYDLYIENYIIDRSPDWRRVGPLIIRCAELHKLDAIQRVVQHVMDKLMYSPMLFDTAEELFSQGYRAAALLLYETVAEGEKFQHSERLALCQYRLFTLRLGDDQEENLQAALQFEPHVKRLDEANQLEALVDLCNIYRSLSRWDRVLKTADSLKSLAKAQLSIKLFHIKRPLFFYIAFSDSLIGGVYYEQGNYDLALEMAKASADLNWVKETDEETLKWKGLFKEWAQANIYLIKLMSGDQSVISDYVHFIESRKNELLPGFWNIMIAANRYQLDVDFVLQKFEPEVYHLHIQDGKPTNNQQNIDNKLVGLFYELAFYYMKKLKFEKSFQYLLDSIVKSIIINDERSLLKGIRLFEGYREFANDAVKASYHNFVGVRGSNETES